MADTVKEAMKGKKSSSPVLSSLGSILRIPGVKSLKLKVKKK